MPDELTSIRVVLPETKVVRLNVSPLVVRAAATFTLHSSADDNDSTTFTPDNSGISMVDVNNVQILSIWTGGSGGSIFVGNTLPAGFPQSQSNFAFGTAAMLNTTQSASDNLAIGAASLEGITTGSGNIAIGSNAGQSIQDGIYNIVIGITADVLQPNASGITLIGAQNDSDVGVTNNATAIGAFTTVKRDNTAVIGNGDVTDVYFGFPTPNLIFGQLVIGNHYLIVNYNVGDDFTNVGAASNATGVVFIATGTTPTDWTNSSALALLTGNSIIHGKGDAIVFPDVDPHVDGAGYWSGGIFTRSNG